MLSERAWTSWGFHEDNVTLDMADTRMYRLSVGPDGQLYSAGETAGGNTIFRYDGKATET